jgi:elongation factor P
MNYGDLRRGHVFEYEGNAYVVVENEHITPGNWRAMNQVKMKNVKTGAVLQRRFRPQDKADVVFVEKKDMQYLFQEGENYIFMEMQTYEQMPIHKDVMGENAQWLLPNITVLVEMFNGIIVNVNLPDTLEVTVKETDPAVKGQTATNQYKPAICDNGIRVMVPPFIIIGEKIRVSTSEAKYLERA